jgi:hypothetical protein
MSSNEDQETQAMPASYAPRAPRRAGGAVSVIALILALAALGLAGWAAFRPTPKPAADAGYSAGQRADAKAATCAAAELVRKGVSLNTNLQSPGGDADVTGSLAVAANARLSLANGGQYLVSRMDPATPTELAADIRDFANTLMDIGAASIAGALNTDPDQAARLSHADAVNVKITEACK